MTSVAVIIGVLLLGAIIQEQINSNKIKQLELKLRHERLTERSEER